MKLCSSDKRYPTAPQLEDSGVLIHGVTETVKREIENMKVDFLEQISWISLLAPLVASLVLQ